MRRSTANLPLQSAMLCFGFVLSFANTSAYADGWPAFRGPTGQGSSSESRLPLTWSESENVTWRTQVPGKGWSSPAIWGDQIWVSTAIEKAVDDANDTSSNDEGKEGESDIAKTVSLRAVCVDKHHGKILHDVELVFVEKPESIHALNSYASPTPVVTQDRVYFHFGTYGTFCIDKLSAEIIWQRRLPLQHAVGPGSSPIVWRDLLILVCDGMEQQYVTARSCETGDEVWKTSRPKMAGDNGDFHKAFSTPLAIESNGEPQLLVPGAQWFVSYEPSTGKMLWRVNHGKGFSNVAAPVFADGIGYLITGFTKPELWAIPVKGRGELTRRDVLWEQKKQVPKKSSPQLVGDAIYMVSDSGVLSCVDLNSGDLHWTARLGGNYSASPLSNNGRIYFSSHEGLVVVIQADADKFQKLAENQLDGQIMASPAADEGALFIRTDQAIYRIEDVGSQ